MHEKAPQGLPDDLSFALPHVLGAGDQESVVHGGQVDHDAHPLRNGKAGRGTSRRSRGHLAFDSARTAQRGSVSSPPMDPVDQMVALAVGAFMVCACNSTSNMPRADPPARPCPDAGPILDLPTGDPPFSSISSADLPKHLPVTWRLRVFILASDAGAQSFELNSKRAGDVPFLAGSGWQCRFDHVGVMAGYSIYRQIRCSSDNWYTSTGDQGEVYASDGKTSAGTVILFKGPKEVGEVTMQPCASKDSEEERRQPCVPAPELP